ncbi:MAG TPA: DUF2442 domain-containing protein [Bacteroidales bacterium]|jgi:hypothetical protein|nr:DUF2442 domain-containing protein [Bacteroidales bacterium]
MLLQVKKAHYLHDYKLYIQFNDGTEGNIDLKETIFEDNRKIFKQLRGVEEFKKFKVALNTICWFNDLDLAPEYMKEKMAEQLHSS